MNFVTEGGVDCGQDGNCSTESGVPLCDGGNSGIWLTHNYYHADGNGNITYLETSLETLAASYTYDPFGSITSQSGGLANANLYRFSSKELHAASGMYYYGYRFYDPNLQRWLNADPITEFGWNALTRYSVGKQGRFRLPIDNPYGFVRGDPVDKYDAVGLLDSITAFILGCLKSEEGKKDPAACFCVAASDEQDCKKKLGDCLKATSKCIPDPSTGEIPKPSAKDLCKCACELLNQSTSQNAIDTCKKSCDKLTK